MACFDNLYCVWFKLKPKFSYKPTKQGNFICILSDSCYYESYLYIPNELFFYVSQTKFCFCIPMVFLIGFLGGSHKFTC